jgi:hypothetical protein
VISKVEIHGRVEMILPSVPASTLGFFCTPGYGSNHGLKAFFGYLRRLKPGLIGLMAGSIDQACSALQACSCLKAR